MLALQELGWFALASLVLVLTPGPNMIYCISRTLCQGRMAGMTSLAGVLAGFLFHLFAAALGLTALLMAVPLAFDAIKLAGAAYLLWLAWQAVRPGGVTWLLDARDLSTLEDRTDSRSRGKPCRTANWRDRRSA